MEKRIRETNASERRRSLGGCACALHRGRSVLTNLYANPVRLTSPRLTCCVQKPLYFLRSRQSLVAASFTPCTIDSSIILGWGGREREGGRSKVHRGIGQIWSQKYETTLLLQEIFSTPVESYPFRVTSTGRDNSAESLQNINLSRANNFSGIDYLDEPIEAVDPEKLHATILKYPRDSMETRIDRRIKSIQNIYIYIAGLVYFRMEQSGERRKKEKRKKNFESIRCRGREGWNHGCGFGGRLVSANSQQFPGCRKLRSTRTMSRGLAR